MILTVESSRQVGITWEIWLMLIKLVSPMPRPIPIKLEVVNWLTDLPEMSPMLFLLANLMLMEPLLADASR